MAALFVLVAACGDDTPGETPDAGPTLDAGFDGAIPPGDADASDGAIPATDADVADAGMSAMDAGGVDGGPSAVDAAVDAGPPGCSPAACDDGVSCTEDVCSEDGRCVHLLRESACARGQYCDLALGCVNGAVCSTDAECADGDPCTTMERCDTSFPRRCTHRILDADADRETTTTCGGGDCNDGSPAVSMMAHQVCGSAVDADCDGLVVFDDLLGTTACANDVLAGGLAACPSDSFYAESSGEILRSEVLRVDPELLDVSLCRNPSHAVRSLAECASRSTCDSVNSCNVYARGAVDSVGVSYTNCRVDFAASCECAAGSAPCPLAVDSLCDSTCTLRTEYGDWTCTPTDVTGAPPTFDVCRDLRSDENHCGACGNVCPAGATCTLGTCCRTSDLECDGNPVTACETDGLTSNAHCGTCGNACTGGQSCVAGNCVCPAGEEYCGGRCVATSNYATDPMNCGACGNACGVASNLCSQGICQCDYFASTCGAGQACTLIDAVGTCVPAMTGSVGAGGYCSGRDSRVCASGLQCLAGYCTRVCRLADGFGCRDGEECLPTPWSSYYGFCRMP